MNLDMERAELQIVSCEHKSFPTLRSFDAAISLHSLTRCSRLTVSNVRGLRVEARVPRNCLLVTSVTLIPHPVGRLVPDYLSKTSCPHRVEPRSCIPFTSMLQLPGEIRTTLGERKDWRRLHWLYDLCLTVEGARASNLMSCSFSSVTTGLSA
jgi:hypothetical protein